MYMSVLNTWVNGINDLNLVMVNVETQVPTLFLGSHTDTLYVLPVKSQ